MLRAPVHLATALFVVTLAMGCGALAARAQQRSALAPLPASQWDLAAARHLLERAGFGGTTQEIAALHALGPSGAVDRLLAFRDLPAAPAFEGAFPPILDPRALAQATPEERRAARAVRNRGHRRAIQELRRWWVQRMCETERPLEEKLTLFWHGHFTSGFRDVRNAEHMARQNELFRAHAAGNFRHLLHGVARDAAMLEYLDNNRNRRGSPNENFARELLELFTLGAGHYGEGDVKEAARAFTGWTFDREGAFRYAPAQHDDAAKTFLGRTARYDGAGIIDAVLREERCAVWICERLWRFFVADEVDPRAVDELAKILRGDARDPYRWSYELEPVLRALFSSRAFHDERVRAARIKSPIELVVGAIRQLELPADRTADLAVTMAAQMGQSLFDPPNVEGWPGGREWISTSALYDRYNFAGLITRDLAAESFQVRSARADESDDEAAMSSGAVGGRVDADAFVPIDEDGAAGSDMETKGGGDGEDDERDAADAMAGGGAASEDRRANVDAKGTRATGPRKPGNPTTSGAGAMDGDDAADAMRDPATATDGGEADTMAGDAADAMEAATARRRGAALARLRANPAERLVRLRFPFPADELARRLGFRDAEGAVDGFSALCLAVPLPATSRRELVAYLDTDTFGRADPFDPAGWDASRRLKGMLHLLLATPEYQLN